MSQVGNSIVANVQKRMFDQMLRMKVSYYGRVAFVHIHRPSGLHRPIGEQRAQPSHHHVFSRRTDDRRARRRHGVARPSAFVPGADVGSARRGRGAQDRHPRAQDHGERVPGRRTDDGNRMQETAQGIRIVKAFTLESFMRARQGEAIEGFRKAANKLARVSSRTSPIMESLGGFAIAAVVLYSGYTVILRGNPPGSLFSFITSVIMLYEPMKRVARLHVDLSSPCSASACSTASSTSATTRRMRPTRPARGHERQNRISRRGVRLSARRASPARHQLRR